MNAEHGLRQRIVVLSGGEANERIAVRHSSAKVRPHGDIVVSALLAEERNPSLRIETTELVPTTQNDKSVYVLAEVRR